jgi:hypothetical protein
MPDTALARHCPLDDGRFANKADGSPTLSLGALARLPIELQHQALLQLDVKSLLDFRRVNKRAMDTVSGMVEWKKVLMAYISILNLLPPRYADHRQVTTHAANALRMAIGFNTHFTFTLTQLLDALYPHKCALCNTETRSFNIIRLQRLCSRHSGHHKSPCFPGKDIYDTLLLSFYC